MPGLHQPGGRLSGDEPLDKQTSGPTGDGQLLSSPSASPAVPNSRVMGSRPQGSNCGHRWGSRPALTTTVRSVWAGPASSAMRLQLPIVVTYHIVLYLHMQPNLGTQSHGLFPILAPPPWDTVGRLGRLRLLPSAPVHRTVQCALSCASDPKPKPKPSPFPTLTDCGLRIAIFELSLSLSLPILALPATVHRRGSVVFLIQGLDAGLMGLNRLSRMPSTKDSRDANGSSPSNGK